MHFLLTGGAGFIGSHVCEALLREGNAVTVVDDENDYYDPAIKRRNLDEIRQAGDFEYLRGDIVDSAFVEKAFAGRNIDQLIHLAARAGVRPSLEQPALYQRVNVEGTVNLLESARRHGVRKAVLASSSSVYGVNAKLPFSETDPLFAPISPYAASKVACEALGHTYHHVYGMDIVMLRFFTVYGPRQRPDLAIHKFASRIADGHPIPVFGDGSSARDYTFIDDILQGVVAATRREFGFEVINLGESQTVTLSRLIELLEQGLGTKAVIDRRPEQPGDVPVTYADVSKARRLLDYRPTTPIETGIQRFLDWFRATREFRRTTDNP